jgi:copper(I)-binding protein
MRRAPLLAASGAALVIGAGGLAAGAENTPPTPPRLSVSGAYVPQPASPDVAAAYLVVRNTGGSPDTLLSVTSPDATGVSLHRTTADSMAELGDAPVPAHGELVLARGGTHLMLMGMAHRPAVGGTVVLRLRFARSGTLTVRAAVEPLTYQPGGPS